MSIAFSTIPVSTSKVILEGSSMLAPGLKMTSSSEKTSTLQKGGNLPIMFDLVSGVNKNPILSNPIQFFHIIYQLLIFCKRKKCVKYCVHPVQSVIFTHGVVFRYGIAVDLEDLTETKSLFYDIYDLKSEEIPSEEEWASRMKEVMSGQDQPLCMKPSEGDWAEEVNVKVTKTEASVMGAVEKDEQKERDLENLQNTKEEL